MNKSNKTPALWTAATSAFWREGFQAVLSQDRAESGSTALTSTAWKYWRAVCSQLGGMVLSFCLLFASGYDAPGEVTNSAVVSPVVTYQYYDAVGEETNVPVVSPVVYYQYFDAATNATYQTIASPSVSYYYPFLDTPPLPIFATSRLPTTAESTSLFIAPPSSVQLESFVNGAFTSGLTLEPNAMTIVLTHGWMPAVAGFELWHGEKGVDGWPTDMARLLCDNGITTANIVAWNWDDASKSLLPGTAAARTPDQGIALGKALANALGPNYSQPIHFVGHSLGTLVNAYAANFLHGDRWANEPTNSSPWPGAKTQMTLFDEAEAATDITSFGSTIDTIAGMNGNPLYRKRSYYHPLPKQFVWADNYVAAFGLLHPEAANVILTNHFPSDEPNGILSWFSDLNNFHGYPLNWYNETIQSDVAAMGFLWSFERSGLSFQAPPANSFYIQAASEWNLEATDWDHGTNFLNGRFQAYRNSLAYALTNETPASASVNGSGSAEYYTTGLVAPVVKIYDNFIMWLLTTPANNSTSPQSRAHPNGVTANDSTSSTNIPAYAWVPLTIPSNAVSMSFDYKIQGDWNDDSLAAAFNGTNVLSLPGSQIETNVLFSSGAIDVSAFAGQTNELFIGIVGGTSTNAQLTVENLAYSISSPPSLQAQVSGSNVVLTWPLLAQNFNLQFTTNLGDSNSWITITNVPAIVNLQNTAIDQMSATNGFYRLKQQ